MYIVDETKNKKRWEKSCRIILIFKTTAKRLKREWECEVEWELKINFLSFPNRTEIYKHPPTHAKNEADEVDREKKFQTDSISSTLKLLGSFEEQICRCRCDKIIHRVQAKRGIYSRAVRRRQKKEEKSFNCLKEEIASSRCPWYWRNAELRKTHDERSTEGRDCWRHGWLCRW